MSQAVTHIHSFFRKVQGMFMTRTYSAPKHKSIIWPVTDVTTMSHSSLPRIVALTFQLQLYGEGPLERGGGCPRFITNAICFATEGFSATLSTLMRGMLLRQHTKKFMFQALTHTREKVRHGSSLRKPPDSTLPHASWRRTRQTLNQKGSEEADENTEAKSPKQRSSNNSFCRD